MSLAAGVGDARAQLEGVLSDAIPDRPEAASKSGSMGVLPACLILAALAQFLFLLHWPMYLYGRWTPYLPAVAVALVRMGVYAGLAWGLVRRDPTAWAGSLGELARSVLLFLLAIWQHGGTLTSELFPAWWAQGLFSAALPVLLVLLTALDWGWRPGTELIAGVSLAARIIVAVTVLTVMSLRRKAPLFRIEMPGENRVLLVRGLPVISILTVVEAIAWVFAGAH
ncbi:MAG: hypothetical protein ACO1SX_15660 [Actinomycetota bacterium]